MFFMGHCGKKILGWGSKKVFGVTKNVRGGSRFFLGNIR